MTDDIADVDFFNDDDVDVDYLDKGEEAVVEEIYASLDDFSEDDQDGVRVGPFTMFTGKPAVIPPGHPVKDVRRAVVHELREIICSEQTGAWLVRHPPGTGKTTAFASIVECHDLPFERPVLGCAPTVAEAEALSAKTGIPVLRAQSTRNCSQMADEADLPKDQRRLARHLAAGHIGSEFCASCRYRETCAREPGQYRHDQAAFRLKVMSRGQNPQYITTTKMLEHLAPVLGKAHDRIVIWTDEDLFPHLRTEVPPVTPSDLMTWLYHADNAGENAASEDVAFMRGVLDAIMQFQVPATPSPEKMTDHSTQTGRVFLAPTELVQKLTLLLQNVTLTESRTHATERMTMLGDELPPGEWRRALFAQVVDLVRGIFWIVVPNEGERSMVGYAINRAMQDLPAKHCFLQSDATATRHVWSGIWGKHWRKMLDGSPERALTVEWWPGLVSQTKDRDFQGALVRIKNLLAKYPGRIGILTFKAWTYKLLHALITAGVMVHMLPHKDEKGQVVGLPITEPPAARVVLGHFGAHDRGVNDYHVADLDAFFVVGSYRPPMSSIHARAATLARLGVDLPTVGQTAMNQMFPPGVDGTIISQEAHKAMRSEDSATNWVADYERAAHLAQSLERIRSVDRAARGMKPIPVYLYGPEASRPIIPLPIRYSLV